MDPKRMKAVKLAYSTLDPEGKGSIPFDVLKSKYIATAHPLTRMKECKPEQITAEFESEMGTRVYICNQ